MENMDLEGDFQKESNLLSLPVEMIDNILSYLSYDQVSKLRLVNRKMNTICCHRLNNGFTQVELFHGKCMKTVKSMLPRRESERKAHPLARHSDILISVETRLSMLSMTFTKYIETNQCCFFPGKVLDEAFRVLHKVSTSLCEMEVNKKPVKVVTYTLLPRPHEFLQEYRDISSMAMEYFDEKILPAIKEKMKNDNSHVYYYKIKPSTSNKSLSHPIMWSITSGSLRAATRNLDKTPVSSNSEPSPSSSCQRTPDGRLLKLLQMTNQNWKSTDKIVARMERKFKYMSSQMKFQTSYMQRKIQFQKRTIQNLKKELEETKSTMDVMRKDINLIKGLHKDCNEMSSVDLPGSSRPNLSICAASSITIPAQPEVLATCPHTTCEGQKRTHTTDDTIQEINAKKIKNDDNNG